MSEFSGNDADWQDIYGEVSEPMWLLKGDLWERSLIGITILTAGGNTLNDKKFLQISNCPTLKKINHPPLPFDLENLFVVLLTEGPLSLISFLYDLHLSSLSKFQEKYLSLILLQNQLLTYIFQTC